MTLDQVKTFKFSLDIGGVEEDEKEEVIDPWYIEQIECFLVPKLDWSKREEDDLHSQTIDVFKRTKYWLKKKKD